MAFSLFLLKNLKMIDQSPDRRPPIAEICESLALRRMSIVSYIHLSSLIKWFRIKTADNDVATAHLNRVRSTVAASIQRNRNWRVDWMVEESVCLVWQITRFHLLSGQKRFYKQRKVHGLSASTGRCGTKAQVVPTFFKIKNTFVCRWMGTN